MEDTDAQLHLKKRARRRLVGAVAFVALVAVVLPMIMDHEPKPVVQDVEIRIPGQDERPFAPRFAAAPLDKQAAAAPEAKPAEKAPEAAARPAAEPKPAAEAKPSAVVVPVKPAEPAPEKPAAKVEKPADKVPAKAEKPADKPAAKETDAKRAAAILAGKAEEAPAKGNEHVVLIGAFANEGNVKAIKSKLGELGIRAYTEPLDSPQGRKTRVRAGPFPNREAAEKALDKMKRIGVSGVVAAKQ